MGWLHSVQRVVTLNRVHEPSLCPAGTGYVPKAGTSGGRSLCSVISDLSPVRCCTARAVAQHCVSWAARLKQSVFALQLGL